MSSSVIRLNGFGVKVQCEAAFLWAKEVLSSDQVLVHYDPSKTLILSVEADPHGIGAGLSHRLEDGSEKPIESA